MSQYCNQPDESLEQLPSEDSRQAPVDESPLKPGVHTEILGLGSHIRLAASLGFLAAIGLLEAKGGKGQESRPKHTKILSPRVLKQGKELQARAKEKGNSDEVVGTIGGIVRERSARVAKGENPPLQKGAINKEKRGG